MIWQTIAYRIPWSCVNIIHIRSGYFDSSLTISNRRSWFEFENESKMRLFPSQEPNCRQWSYLAGLKLREFPHKISASWKNRKLDELQSAIEVSRLLTNNPQTSLSIEDIWFWQLRMVLKTFAENARQRHISGEATDVAYLSAMSRVHLLPWQFTQLQNQKLDKKKNIY